MNITAVAAALMFHDVYLHLALIANRVTGSAVAQVIRVRAEISAGGDLVDNLSVGVESKPDKIERGGWRRGDAGAVVGIVGGLEQRLGIDRETEVAADRAAVGAGEFGAARGVYENRLADHRRVKPAVAVAIGLADDFRIAASEPAGKKGRDVCDLPRGQVCADDERCLGAVHHAAHPSVAAGAVLNVRAR